MSRDARHYPGPGRVAHWLPVVLVATMLAVAVPAHRLDWGQRHLPWLAADPASEPEAVAPPPGLELPDWTPPPTPVATPSAALDPEAVAQALAPGLGDEDLGRRVVAAVGGVAGPGPIWSTAQQRYLPASTTKVLTGAAALDVLGPDTTFTTRVTTGRTGRELVLVGGGDPYLASQPLEPAVAAATYPDRADVATLAARAVEALSTAGELPARPVRVVYDDSLFTGPSASPGWRADYVPEDIVAPITALMVDSGSDGAYTKADDPSLFAARAFAAGLEAAGVEVAGRPRPGVVPPGAEDLAAVESAPLAAIVERVLEVSDNEGSEVLAHHVGLAAAGEGSFAAGARATLDALAAAGVEVSGARLLDGSGLSRRNRLSTTTVLGVLQLAATPEQDDLRPVLTGLPVAGFTGSLALRFEDGAPVGRGAVRAKTGTLTGVHALAGQAVSRDGATMVFVLAADRVPVADSLDARQALDQAAAALAACRCAASG